MPLSLRCPSGIVSRFLAAALTASTLAPPSVPLLSGALVPLLVPRVAMAAGGAAFDINTADAATLAATLPGIGPIKASRIVEHRERHGTFDTLEALLAVKGIGPATLERIRVHLQGGAVSTERGARASDLGAGAPIAPSLSTRELERATRAAVRQRVAAAERDAAPYR